MTAGNLIEEQVRGYGPAFLAVSGLVLLGVWAWTRKWRRRRMRAAVLAGTVALLVAPTLAVGGHGGSGAPFCFTFGYFLSGAVDPGAVAVFAVVPFCATWVLAFLAFVFGERLHSRRRLRRPA